MNIPGRLLASALFASALLTGAGESTATTASHKSVQGFSYRHDEMPAGPWSAHIVKIDRSRKNLELHTTLPPGRRFGLVNVSSQVKALGSANGQPLAAINGDYYEGHHSSYRGDPQGLQIMRGELISAPYDWTCFWIDPSGNPKMGKVDDRFCVTFPDGSQFAFGLNEARTDDDVVIYTPAVGPTTRTRNGTDLVLEMWSAGPQLPFRAGERYFARVVEIDKPNSKTAPNRLVLSIGSSLLKKIPIPEVGDKIRISTATSPSLKNVQTAIGGGPAILRDKKSAFPHQARVRHPRSVIGWNDKFFFLVEVDGRQPGLSVGMTFEELSSYLLKLGCTDAMSLDGGGSSTLWALGQVMNNPSEGGERGAANALVVLNTER